MTRRLVQGIRVDEQQIRQEFDDVLDQALVFHGFADYNGVHFLTAYVAGV